MQSRECSISSLDLLKFVNMHIINLSKGYLVIIRYFQLHQSHPSLLLLCYLFHFRISPWSIRPNLDVLYLISLEKHSLPSLWWLKIVNMLQYYWLQICSYLSLIKCLSVLVYILCNWDTLGFINSINLDNKQTCHTCVHFRFNWYY